MTTPDEDVSKFTGFKRYFNTMTLNGRFNIVCATYASVGLYFLYLKFKPKSEKPKTA